MADGKPIKISVLADTKVAQASLGQLRDATAGTEERFDAMARGSSDLANKIDAVGGASAKVSGAIGDVGGSLNSMGLISDKTADSLNTGAQAIMGLAGVADLAVTASAAFAAAKDVEFLANARATAGMVASKVAMVAGATVSGIMTAAQWALNAAMTANPIGLVIAAIALLVAGFVIAYKKSETFRNIVQGALRGVQAAFAFWWSAVKVYIGFFVALPARFAAVGRAIVHGLADAIAAGKALLKAAVSKLVGFLPGFIKSKLGISSPSKVTYALGEQVTKGLAQGITGQLGSVRAAMAKVSSTVATADLTAPSIQVAGTATASGSSGAAVHIEQLTIQAAPGSDGATLGKQFLDSINQHLRVTGVPQLGRP